MTPTFNLLRPSRAVLLCVAAAATMLSTACGKKADDASAGADKPASASTSVAAPPRGAGAANVGQQAVAKFNAYTSAYNKLIGTFGLTETRESYFDKDMTKRKAADSLSVTDGWVEGALEALKKGRALPASGLESLDASADALIGALDKLVVQLKGLHVYYESKAYKDDNLARGKAEDAPLRANFDASVAAMKAFNVTLSKEQQKRDAETLARLKASGDMLSYNTKLAIGQGEQLVNLFNDAADFKAPAKYAEGDALVSELEKTLAAQRALYAAAKATPTPPDSDHESAASSLVSLVGAYRDMKQSRQAKDFNDMVKSYNRAVESANDIR